MQDGNIYLWEKFPLDCKVEKRLRRVLKIQSNKFENNQLRCMNTSSFQCIEMHMMHISLKQVVIRTGFMHSTSYFSLFYIRLAVDTGWVNITCLRLGSFDWTVEHFRSPISWEQHCRHKKTFWDFLCSSSPSDKIKFCVNILIRVFAGI